MGGLVSGEFEVRDPRLLSTKMIGPPSLFLLAAIIQMAFLFVLLPARYHVNDNDNYRTFYEPVAENILAGKGLVGADEKIALTYPPGYPAVIATTFALAERLHLNRERTLDILNILITSLSCLVLFLTVREAFGERIGLLTWLLWISYLPNLWTLVRPNPETPFTLLLYCGVWAFVRAMKRESVGGAVTVGVTLGLAALIRPIGVFLPFVLAAIALLFAPMAMKKRIFIASLIVAGFLISVTPWETFVMSKTGKLVLLCTNGPSSMADGLVFALQREPEDQPMWAPAPVIGMMERANARRSEMQTTGSVLGFAWGEAKTHPLAFAEFLLLKFFRPWYSTATRRRESPIVLLQIFYVPLGVAGLFWGKKRYPKQTLAMGVFVSVVVYFWAMALLTLPIFRYLVPAFGYVIIFVAIAIEALIASVRSAAQVNAVPSPR
jgi:4-amino-4-deoxy-L-arabinose transferase-like glycosyltransferase